MHRVLRKKKFNIICKIGKKNKTEVLEMFSLRSVEKKKRCLKMEEKKKISSFTHSLIWNWKPLETFFSPLPRSSVPSFIGAPCIYIRSSDVITLTKIYWLYTHTLTDTHTCLALLSWNIFRVKESSAVVALFLRFVLQFPSLSPFVGWCLCSQLCVTVCVCVFVCWCV